MELSVCRELVPHAKGGEEAGGGLTPSEEPVMTATRSWKRSSCIPAGDGVAWWLGCRHLGQWDSIPPQMGAAVPQTRGGAGDWPWISVSVILPASAVAQGRARAH